MPTPEDELEDRPRVIGVRFGANPNSSSLGVDVTFLLFGGTAALAAGLFLTSWLRARRKPAEVVGQGDSKAAP
jgi:hypothetical protein